MSDRWRTGTRAGWRSLVSALLLLTAAARGEAQMVKIRAGSSLSPPTLDGIAPYVASERDLFRKHGVEVELLAFRGGPTHLKAILAGEVDVAVAIGATGAIVAAAKGARIRAWMVPQPVTRGYLVARRDAGTTLQALAGKTVAVAGIGAISYHIPRIIFQRSGLDPDMVKYIAVGSPADRFRALLAGKVDAAVVTNTEAAKLEQYPQIVPLVQVPEVVPEIPYEISVARTSYLEKNPDGVLRLTRALLEANRWIAANRAGTVGIAAKVLKEESPEVLGRAYDMSDPRQWGVNGDITEAAYRSTVDFLLKVGDLNDPVPYEKFFDRRFVDQALKELGRM